MQNRCLVATHMLASCSRFRRITEPTANSIGALAICPSVWRWDAVCIVHGPVRSKVSHRLLTAPTFSQCANAPLFEIGRELRTDMLRRTDQQDVEACSATGSQSTSPQASGRSPATLVLLVRPASDSGGDEAWHACYAPRTPKAVWVDPVQRKRRVVGKQPEARASHAFIPEIPKLKCWHRGLLCRRSLPRRLHRTQTR